MGKQELFVDDKARITGDDALRQARCIAQAMSAFGLDRGDRVAFLCKGSARHAVVWCATPLNGFIACNLHVREPSERLGQVINWLDAKLLVHDEDLEEAAIATLRAAKRSIPRISLGNRGSAERSFDDLTNGVVDLPPSLRPVSPGDIAAIVMSSGTTGRPKGIMHSQASLLEAAKGGQLILGAIGRGSAGIIFMQPSFAGWAICMLPFLGGKSRIVFGGQFNPLSFLQVCEREKITHAPLVPTMWRMVFESGPGNFDLSSLAYAAISGEAPSLNDVKALREICPNINCVYTASEAFSASSVTVNSRELIEGGKIGSSGRPGVGVDIRILAPDGPFDEGLPVGEVGEIAISGPSTALGYWNDPDLTRKRFFDGWWRSGDLGSLDEDGFLWIRGRVDNVINTGGIKVNGEEVEKALLSHPLVVQCAVVGQPDNHFGQRIEAYLIVRDKNIDLGEVSTFLREEVGLPGFAVPKRFHLTDELPIGPTGKLFRRALRGDGHDATSEYEATLKSAQDLSLPRSAS
jgi:acyl-CoA synthetase (AMP-forming)/AMP-acid ligase II